MAGVPACQRPCEVSPSLHCLTSLQWHAKACKDKNRTELYAFSLCIIYIHTYNIFNIVTFALGFKGFFMFAYAMKNVKAVQRWGNLAGALAGRDACHRASQGCA